MSDSVLKNGVTLAAIAAICTTLVATTYHLTKDRIVANERAFLERKLAPVLGGIAFEGSISESKRLIKAPHGLPGREDALIYRVYSDSQPVAALFAVTAPDGYAGPIRILLGIDVNGVVTGLRILEHRETPGLGDKIEENKSDWVHQFNGKSLGNPVIEDWSIRRDGGEFDQLSGASVTPRAVINAVRGTLLYFSANRDQVFTIDDSDDTP